ncbi:hypothetical protein NQ318_001212 [Aromia moschata]|uniref:TsaA-like domain-containing protein n=1 Tax=Aromia moschata TaxID=1265417 RepID=A0AAV8ZGW8_9CUCU|nr:hypothetical protein NQ318_001212 [Aromia moschata]
MSNSVTEKPLDAVSLQNQLAIARKEIYNLRQQLVSLNHIHRKEYESVYKKLEQWQCLSCRSKEPVQETSNTLSASSENNFKPVYIGTISTHFPEKRGTPRQPGICNDMIAKLSKVYKSSPICGFCFIFIKNDSTHVRAKVTPPRLNGIRTGVFATRSPHRPSPIGLSLVKIDRIMENTIYFSGVDMVDQTPVLDIKPYIPQYDNPGLSNIYYPEESLLDIRDENIDSSLLDTSSGFSDNVSVLNNSEASTSTRENIDSSLTNLNVRVMDGEENERREQVLGAASTENNRSQTEESFYTRSDSRIGEREAPDGEEGGDSKHHSKLLTASTPEGHVRVPSWIDQPPVPRLMVLFKDRALTQLTQLEPEGEEKKTTITNVLKEDPRSVYLRERWGSHCYVFRIAELYVSCKFNDSTQTVTVYQVFQNEAPPESDD